MSLATPRLLSTGPAHCIDLPNIESLNSHAFSRQSLLDLVSSKINFGRGKKYSRDSFSNSYIHRINAASDTDINRRTKEARRRDIKSKFGKLDRLGSSVTGVSERFGCHWTLVFDPAGRLCYYWTAIVSLAFLYNLWFIIYRFAFDEIRSDTMILWFCLDYFADFVYILDIIFNFRTGYLEDGVLQTAPKKLRQHYMNSTTFYVDCLCLLPLDFLYLSIGFKSILRCFRLVKIYKFWYFLDRTERHTNSPNFFRSVSLIHYLFVIFHWNSCVFYLIYGKFHNYDNYIIRWLKYNDRSCPTNSTSPKVPISIEEPLDGEHLVPEYFEALYWCTLSLTTVGGMPKPCTKFDYSFQIWQLLFGLLLFATVLGHIANIVTNVSAARKEFQAKLDGVKTYMGMRRVPKQIQNKVIKWFDYLWLTQKCSDEEKSISCLPDKLKAEIAIHVHLDTLKRVEIFQNTEAGFLCELVLKLRPVLFSPGDYICRKGEVGKEMYIVNRGKLLVVADDGKTMLATLKAGSYFGEISILNMGTAGNRRTASVRSVGYSDLFVLSKKDMWDVLKEYPAARVRLEAIAAKRLEKYKCSPIRKTAVGRSTSTPGLLESSGKIPLDEMWLSSVTSMERYDQKRLSSDSSKRLSDSEMHASKSVDSRPGFCTSSVSPIPKTQFSDSLGQKNNSAALSDTSHSSHHSQSTDESNALIPMHISHQNNMRTAQSGTTASVTSCDSYDKRSIITSPNNAVSPLTSPNYATSRVAYSLPVPMAEKSTSSLSEHAFNSGSPNSAPTPIYRTSHSVGAFPISHSHGHLAHEIRRLRENLKALVTENAVINYRLSKEQWSVENRLHDLERQYCAPGPNDDVILFTQPNDRNYESSI